MAQRQQPDEDAPLFAIAAAAELSGMHPQTLRQYDRLGLVVPGRSPGGSRRYSLRHIEQLREVARLSGEGVSLPAISRILALEAHVRALSSQVSALEERVRAELANRPGARVFAAGTTGQVIPVRSGRRIRHSREIMVWRPDSEK